MRATRSYIATCSAFFEECSETRLDGFFDCHRLWFLDSIVRWITVYLKIFRFGDLVQEGRRDYSGFDKGGFRGCKVWTADVQLIGRGQYARFCCTVVAYVVEVVFDLHCRG